MAGAPSRPFSFYVDRGGTFTDVVARIQGPGPERLRVLKVRRGVAAASQAPLFSSSSLTPLARPPQLLSVDPAYPDAPTEGIRRILEQGAS